MTAFISAMGLVCSLGSGHELVRASLFARRPPAGLSRSEMFSPGRSLLLGVVEAPLPDTAPWPLAYRTRTNQLAAEALLQINTEVATAAALYGPDRLAVVIGGSTAGMREGELAVKEHHRSGRWPADYHFAQQELGSTADFLSWKTGSCGPAHVISTACSSGAKALISAARMLEAGLADAVLCGGADALCRLTVAGFSALEAVSDDVCNPLSMHRRGINLGEGAALFLVTREPAAVKLGGYGEADDAYHLSAPAPDGRGAIKAMRQSLQRAGLDASAVDYVNLHGTATLHNDAMESIAVSAVFGDAVAVSSTKPHTGHTLGAAGAIEAAFCWLTLVDNPRGSLPVHWWDGCQDVSLPPLRVVGPGNELGRPARHLVSNSFAFGGSNVSLLMSTA